MSAPKEYRGQFSSYIYSEDIMSVNPYLIKDTLIDVDTPPNKPYYLPKPTKAQKKINKPLDKIIPVLNYPEFRYLDRLSLELEGAWYDKRDDIHKDLSFCKEDFDIEFHSVGEFTSQPLTTFNEWAECLINNYPDQSCDKCGFHIHFSLKCPAHYMLCMEKKFYHEFLHSLQNWGIENIKPEDVFWSRLNGGNKYCQNIFMPDTQASYREKGINRKDRRTILNYTYRHLGTIEVRVLPMFKDYNLAISAIANIVQFVEKYISDNKNNNIQLNEKIGYCSPIRTPEIIKERILLKPCNFTLGKYNFFVKDDMNKITKGYKKPKTKILLDKLLKVERGIFEPKINKSEF